MRFSLFCIGNRQDEADDEDDVYASVDAFEDDDDDDCVAKLMKGKDDDDNKSEATEVTSNTSTIDHHMDTTNHSSHLITASVLDASNTTGPSSIQEESESARRSAQVVLTIAEATDDDIDNAETCCVRRQAGDAAEARVQFSSAPHRGDPPAWPSRRRRGLPPRDSKHRSRVTTCCASLPAASKQPANTAADAAPPKRRGLPPRDRPSARNCALRICRVPSTSREAIENAKLVSQVRPPTTTHGGIAALRMPVRQPTVCDDHDDEQSRGMSLFSKPSVIRVETNPEEDFEHFHEVEDDDQLCLDGSQHLMLVNHHNNNNNGNSSHLLHGSGSTTATASASGASSTGASVRIPVALTEERVRAHLRDYYEDFDSIFRLGKSSSAAWESFFSQYFTPDIQWVRSSSNSLTGPELAEHFAKDIKGIGMELVSIDSIQVLAFGLSAVVTFTADQRFEYRGTPNSDRTVVTMVLTVDGSPSNNGKEIRIAHEHRCTGKPIPNQNNEMSE